MKLTLTSALSDYFLYTFKDIHGGEKMCDQCGETFDMPSLLKQHYKNVHSVFTINRTCKTCGYEGKTTGSSSKSLHAHMLQKHPDPARLTCQICNHLSTSLRDTYVHFKVRIKFSNFSCIFVNPNNFFKFEF